MNYEKLTELEHLIKSIAHCKTKQCNMCTNNNKNDYLCYEIRNNNHRSLAYHIITNIHEYMDIETKTIKLNDKGYQYTGINDKDGKEIYENDYFDESGIIGIVKFGKYTSGSIEQFGFYVDWELRKDLIHWSKLKKIRK